MISSSQPLPAQRMTLPNSLPVIQVVEGLIINSTDDDSDLAPGDGNCDADACVEGPQCTLRAAIEEVNALAESNIDVYFAIKVLRR